tara:strand:+ start:142 stop:726 length:585 start_codon:yes stop_codon:yes gene_type:complete
MRALILALLLLASPSYAGETILSGDSDHTYLPVQSDREVLLHEFTYLSDFAAPASYLTWGTSYNANCLQQYGYQGDGQMASTARECSLPQNAFRAARAFTLTRVIIFPTATGPFSTNALYFIEARVARVDTGGALTVVGQPLDLNFPGPASNNWNLNVEIAAGQGIGVQYRATDVFAVSDYQTYPIVQIWGIWK